jgi:NAD-dependent deacetylase
MNEGRYRNIVVLTGAGISAESGLGTFRDTDGLWSTVDPEDVATPQAFARDPDGVNDFHNILRKKVIDAAPNAAHEALAMLEYAHPGELLLVTQNVDDLHERAGSENVLHMHGEMFKARCQKCGQIAEWRDDLTTASACPACDAPGAMRPHVVWFGEMPFGMDRIYMTLARCDLFVSIGTSGNVYPAAGFVEEVRGWNRAHTVELNLEPSEGASHFAEAINGAATEVVPAYVERLLAAAGDV